MTPIVFEDRPAIDSEVEVLQMISGKSFRGNPVGVEGFVCDHATQGLYVCLGMLSGWPERVEWQKFYRLEKQIFETLKSKGYIRKGTPTTWNISPEGLSYLIQSV